METQNQPYEILSRELSTLLREKERMTNEIRGIEAAARDVAREMLKYEGVPKDDAAIRAVKNRSNAIVRTFRKGESFR